MSKSQITNRKWRIAKIIVFIIAVGLFFISNAATAETIDPQKIKEQRKKLEKELQEYEFQINRYQKLIEEKQIQATTMERDIAILNAKIDKLKLEIKARKIAIEELAQELAEKENSIAKLVKKSEAIKESLAELLRQVYEIEQNSLIELILNKEEFSDSFKEIDSLELAQSSLQDSLGALRISNKQLEEEKNSLEERQTEEVRLKITQELSTETIKEKEKEQKKFLKEQEKSAATIRSRLFLLAGSPAIPFEKAIEYANLAFNTTGVRPAFLLAVITEESNLGRNIGTGDWKEEMKKCPKQQTAFQEITQKLGLDPNLMPVSKRAWYGNCGGAMGPAQFMPTTWLLYENRIKNLVGEKPSPWNPKHAFLAAALYLKDVGAANGGPNLGRTAALKYLADSNWNKKAYSFYGNEVLEIASKYQKEIDIVKES